MRIINFKTFIIAFLFAMSLCAQIAHADSYDDFLSAYQDLKYVEGSKKAGRNMHLLVGDKFYKLYAANVGGELADKCLYYSSQAYYTSYVKFRDKSDLLKTLQRLKLLAVNFDSEYGAMAYIQLSDIYMKTKDFVSAKYALAKLKNKHKEKKYQEAADKRLAILSKMKGNAFDYTQTARTKSQIKKDNEAVVNKDNNTDKTIKTAKINETENPEKILTANDNDTEDNDNLTITRKIEDQDKILYKGDSENVVVNAIKTFSGTDYTRVVIDMTGKATFEKRWLRRDPSLGKPPRLFIDIHHSKTHKSVPRVIKPKDSFLRSIRWGYNRPGVTRVVLDTDKVKDFTVFRMTEPHKIIIDLSSKDLHDGKSKIASNPYTSTNSKVKPYTKVTNANNNKITLAATMGLKIRKVVIDPGHGGKDPGATYGRLKEKDIVLDIGKKLYRKLRTVKGLKVYMTRDKDVFIPLEERTAFANRVNADIFVSLHVNASRNRRSYGVETFVLNITNDKSALEVAAKENMATAKSMGDLQGILKDILMNSKLEESLILADYTQRKLFGGLYRTRHANRGVKQAPFYVLVGAKMPSILIEMGFLSNRSEAKKLSSRNYREKISNSIYKGLKEYIRKVNG